MHAHPPAAKSLVPHLNSARTYVIPCSKISSMVHPAKEAGNVRTGNAKGLAWAKKSLAGYRRTKL